LRVYSLSMRVGVCGLGLVDWGLRFGVGVKGLVFGVWGVVLGVW